MTVNQDMPLCGAVSESSEGCGPCRTPRTPWKGEAASGASVGRGKPRFPPPRVDSSRTPDLGKHSVREDAPDDLEEMVAVERLGHVVHGAKLHRFLRQLDTLVGGEHEDGQRLAVAF